MKKALIMIFLAYAILLSGCTQPPMPGNGMPPPPLPGGGVPPLFAGVLFTGIVEGCAETAEGMAARAPGFEERPATLTVEGNTIIYDRAVEHLCCRKAKIEKEFSYEPEPEDGAEAMNPQITIYETWSGPGCRCMCASELGAEIENLPEAVYAVRVVERGVSPDGNEMEETVLVEGLVEVLPEHPPEEPALEEMQACETHSDCMLMDEGCCSCSYGGKRVSINKEFEQDYYYQFLEICARVDIACIAVISDDPSCDADAEPVCDGGKCSFLVMEESPPPCPVCGG